MTEQQLPGSLAMRPTSEPYAHALLTTLLAEGGHDESLFGELIERLNGRGVADRHRAWARAHTCKDISESEYVMLRAGAGAAGEAGPALAATVWVERLLSVSLAARRGASNG